MVQSAQLMQVSSLPSHTLFLILSVFPSVSLSVSVSLSLSLSLDCFQYSEDDIPEARFSYDISPMSVSVVKKGKQWYEFLTSICALIGGTFTMVGLISGFLSTIFKSKKI
jgi:hypothetical protein